jgi:type IV pilus assembly protein PilO
MAIDLKTGNMPKYLKIIFIVVPSIIFIILAVTLIFSPKNKQIKKLSASIAKLDNEIKTAEVQVRRLDELRAENARLQAQLEELKEKLPEEKEVSVLLKQISDLGQKSGLIVLLWKPQPRKPDPKEIYIEIPVSMQIVGGYHDLGVFFSHISRIKRIVNISNIKIELATKAGANLIKGAFIASTFSAVDKPGGGTVSEKKKK